MGWSLGFDSNWKRDIGYGVPAYCDHPGCGKEIDRGLAYVCGGDPYGGEKGCGLYFCEDHRGFYNKRMSNGELEYVELCYRCGHYKKPYKPKPEHPTWAKFKLTDRSWAMWRKQNPDEVKKLTEYLNLLQAQQKKEVDHGKAATDNTVQRTDTQRQAH